MTPRRLHPRGARAFAFLFDYALAFAILAGAVVAWLGLDRLLEILR